MELLHRSDGIGPKRRFVNVLVISRHLACVGVRALRVRQLEIREKIVQGGADRTSELPREELTCTARGCSGTAQVVMEEHEGDVVPVFRRASFAGRARLGKKKTGKFCDSQLDYVQDSSDLRLQFSRCPVSGGEPGASEVDRPKGLAIIEFDGCSSRRAVEVR